MLGEEVDFVTVKGIADDASILTAIAG